MKLYRECPYCLNGWQRDAITGHTINGEEITSDIECGKCNGTGFVKINKVFQDTVKSLYEIDNLGFVDAIRAMFNKTELF